MAIILPQDEVLDSELLKTFYYVVELNSTTKAGQVLHLTQSAISHKIKKLEERVGRELLTRKGRNFLLTSAGEQLFYYSKKILKLNSEVLSRISTSDNKTEIKIGMPYVYWRYLLDHLEIDFFKKRGMVIQLHCANSTNLHQLYDQHEIDICMSVRHDELTHGEILGNEELCWVGARNGGSYQKRPLPLVVFDEECIYRKKMLSTLEEQGIPWEIVLISQDTSAVREAIKNDYGVSLLGSRTINEDLEILGADVFPTVSGVDLELRFREDDNISDVVSMIKEIFSAE